MAGFPKPQQLFLHLRESLEAHIHRQIAPPGGALAY
jgi:hypothetical protein